MKVWIRIENAEVRHIWHDAEGRRYEIPPEFYPTHGTPVHHETGEDLEYSHTEVLSEIGKGWKSS